MSEKEKITEKNNIKEKSTENKKTKNSKKRKATGIAWIMIILVLCIAIPLNVLADKFDISWDMTPSHLYSLTKTSTDYLDSLDKDGTVVDFYFLADMSELERSDADIAFNNLLKQYRRHKCIKFHSFDPDSEPEKVDALNPDGFYNLKKGDILIKCGDYTKKVPGSLMYRYNGYTNSSGNWVTTSEYFNGENYITGAIKTAVTGYTPTVYFVTGHGEKTIKDNYKKFQANLQNGNYGAEELDLAKVDEIPDDTALLLFAAPTKDITKAEKSKVESYLDKGGNITFLMSPNSEKMDYKNIEAIMKEFCVKMDYDRVRETDSSKHKDGDEFTIQCNLTSISSTDEDSTESTSQSNNYEMGAVNSETDEDDLVDLTSSLISNGTVTFMPESRSFYPSYESNYSSMVMTSLITANTSAVGDPYGGTNDDADTVTDSSSGLTLSLYSMDKSRNDAKLVCFGSADFISDDNLNGDYFINPVNLLLSSISWMSNNDFDMGIAGKQNAYDSIPFKTSSKAQSTMVVLVIMPIVVAVAGILIWLKRRHS